MGKQGKNIKRGKTEPTTESKIDRCQSEPYGISSENQKGGKRNGYEQRRKKRVVQISNTRCQSCGNSQCTLNNHEDYNTTIVKRNQTCRFHGNRRNYFQEGLGQCTRCLQTSNIEKTSVRCDRGFKETSPTTGAESDKETATETASETKESESRDQTLHKEEKQDDDAVDDDDNEGATTDTADELVEETTSQTLDNNDNGDDNAAIKDTSDELVEEKTSETLDAVKNDDAKEP